MTLVRHHATIFLDPSVAGPVEDLRARWDPAMAAQIAAHVTLVYPWEADDPAAIAGWIRRAARRTAPFPLRVTAAVGVEDPTGWWCGFEVLDDAGALDDLRRAIDDPCFRPGTVPPHVTVVHPRTSALGREAWAELSGTVLDLEVVVREVAVTAWDGTRWPTVTSVALEG